MDALKKVFCCLIPGLKRNNRREENVKKTQMERCREKVKQIYRLKVCRDYSTRKERIVSGIAFDYFRVIVIWVQDGRKVFRSDVVEQVHTYGEVLFLQDRWTINEEGLRIWRGLIVGFKMIEDAEKASLDLPQKIRYVRSTMLRTVVDTLIDCELLHPDRCSRDDLSKVIISRKVPLRVTEVDHVHRELATYGCLQSFFYSNSDPFLFHHHDNNSNSDRVVEPGWRCEVTYPYLTQAYLALLMTDGLLCGWGAVYTSTIERHTRDRQILATAKECIVFLAQCCFPK